MTFAPERFLAELGIESKPSGTANLVIHCPWCGADDKSFHLGIRLDGTAWGCWRNSAHRGRRPYRLVKQLSGWSHQRVLEYLGEGQSTGDSVGDLRARLSRMDAPAKPAPRRQLLRFPNEFRAFEQSTTAGPGRLFVQYLRHRGFRGTSVWSVAKRYRMRWATSGKWAWRVILPVIDAEGLIGWTARACTLHARTRYMAHPPGKEIKRHLFNGWRAIGGRVLLIVEGPMDAIKVDWAGHQEGVHAVALMGIDASPEQEVRLRKVAQGYDLVCICLDSTAIHQALRLQSQLSDLSPKLVMLPEGVKDPGDLTHRDARVFVRRLLSMAPPA